MRGILLAGITSLALVAMPLSANAGERTVTGAAIGAGAGALVLGPVGAVAGGAIGAWVGGPSGYGSRWPGMIAHSHLDHVRVGLQTCYFTSAAVSAFMAVASVAILVASAGGSEISPLSAR